MSMERARVAYVSLTVLIFTVQTEELPHSQLLYELDLRPCRLNLVPGLLELFAQIVAFCRIKCQYNCRSTQ